MREFHVYILSNPERGTRYVGATSDLQRRLAKHRSMAVHSFTRMYGIGRLVHVESFDEPEHALRREKRLKHWNREWQIGLIEAGNPDWQDLAASERVVVGPPPSRRMTD